MYTMIYTLENFFIDQRESTACTEPIIQIEIILTWKTPIIGRNTERKIIKFLLSIFGTFFPPFPYTATLGASRWHGEQKKAKWGNKMAERGTFPSLGKHLPGEKGFQRFKLSAYSSAENCHGFNAKKPIFFSTPKHSPLNSVSRNSGIDIFNICPALVEPYSVIGERRSPTALNWAHNRRKTCWSKWGCVMPSLPWTGKDGDPKLLLSNAFWGKSSCHYTADRQCHLVRMPLGFVRTRTQNW